MKKHYLLFAVSIVYATNGISRTAGMNVLAVEDSPNVDRSLLGHAQQKAQVRFMSEVDPKAEIKDVFIQNIMNLGHMTEEEFHGEFHEKKEAANAEPTQRQETTAETPVAAATPTTNDQPVGSSVGSIDAADIPAALLNTSGEVRG